MPQKRSFIWKIPKEDFEKDVKASISYNQLVKKYYNQSGNRRTIKARIEEDKIDISHFKGKSWAKNNIRPECAINYIPLEQILIENSDFSNGQRIKKKLIQANILEDKCSECGLGNIWNGKAIVLQIDHINGKHSDNRIENIRILCPNCHSQTNTFCGKNNTIKEEVIEKNIIDSSMILLDKDLEINREICPDCSGKKSARSTRCKKCASKIRGENSRKVKDRPSKEILKKELEETSYVSIGKKYGVSDNTIRKWLK